MDTRPLWRMRTHLTHTSPTHLSPCQAWIASPEPDTVFCVSSTSSQAPSSVPARRHTQGRNKTDHQSHGHKAERREMKAAVATGNQACAAEVSHGAMSIPSRERERKGRHRGNRLLSKTLFLECGPFMLSGSTPRWDTTSGVAGPLERLCWRWEKLKGTAHFDCPLWSPTSLCLWAN